MTLPCRQERILRRADRALSRSDPHLALMLSIFARLAAAERMPAREQLRAPPGRAWRVLLRPAAAAVFLVIFAAGGGAGAARRAAAACAAASARCVRRVRGIRTASPAATALPAAHRDRPRP
jgi:hypothetical protein